MSSQDAILAGNPAVVDAKLMEEPSAFSFALLDYVVVFVILTISGVWIYTRFQNKKNAVVPGSTKLTVM